MLAAALLSHPISQQDKQCSVLPAHLSSQSSVPAVCFRSAVHVNVVKLCARACVCAYTGLAVDWLNDNLYWTDYTFNQVWLARIDGRHQRIIASNLSGPGGVVLDHTKKLVVEFARKAIPGLAHVTSRGHVPK